MFCVHADAVGMGRRVLGEWEGGGGREGHRLRFFV